MRKYLLIIDLQKQFADSCNNNRNYNRCLNYIDTHKFEYDGGIVATLFKQDKHNGNFQNHLSLNDCMHANPDDLDFYDTELQKQGITIIQKNGYGDSSEEQYLTHSCFMIDDQIDIIGCDAISGIMAVCFQLWDAGFQNLRILTDYIYTISDHEIYGITRETWINLLRKNFGDCVIIPKRRISFDALFIAPGKSIEYYGQPFEADIALYFEYKMVYGNGTELYLEKDIQGIGSAPCVFSIDKEKGYRMDFANAESCAYLYDVYPSCAFLWKNASTPIEIPFEDAVQLLKDHFDLYNTSNNRPAQSTAYGIREIN
jgi:hypothetical protein